MRDIPLLLITIGCVFLVASGIVIGARCAAGADDDLPGVGAPIPGVGTIAVPVHDSGKPAPQPGRKVVLQGSGYWIAPEPVAAGDSLPVELTVVQAGESIGVSVSIDSVPVVWQTLELHWPRERFGAFGEAAWIGDRFRPAVGLSWKPAVILGAEIGPAVSVGLDAPLWGAVSGRASRRIYSTIEAGLEVGYRIGDHSGLHIGFGAGFAF